MRLRKGQVALIDKQGNPISAPPDRAEKMVAGGGYSYRDAPQPEPKGGTRRKKSATTLDPVTPSSTDEVTSHDED